MDAQLVPLIIILMMGVSALTFGYSMYYPSKREREENRIFMMLGIIFVTFFLVYFVPDTSIGIIIGYSIILAIWFGVLGPGVGDRKSVKTLAAIFVIVLALLTIGHYVESHPANVASEYPPGKIYTYSSSSIVDSGEFTVVMYSYNATGIKLNWGHEELPGVKIITKSDDVTPTTITRDATSFPFTFVPLAHALVLRTRSGEYYSGTYHDLVWNNGTISGIVYLLQGKPITEYITSIKNETMMSGYTYTVTHPLWYGLRNSDQSIPTLQSRFLLVFYLSLIVLLFVTLIVAGGANFDSKEGEYFFPLATLYIILIIILAGIHVHIVASNTQVDYYSPTIIPHYGATTIYADGLHTTSYFTTTVARPVFIPGAVDVSSSITVVYPTLSINPARELFGSGGIQISFTGSIAYIYVPTASLLTTVTGSGDITLYYASKNAPDYVLFITHPNVSITINVVNLYNLDEVIEKNVKMSTVVQFTRRPFVFSAIPPASITQS